MKYFIITSFFLFSLTAGAAKPPSQEVVDLYVTVALRSDENALRGTRGKWECEFSYIHDSSLKVLSDNQEEAIQRLQLLCIKSQCGRLGQIMSQGTQSLQNISEQEFRDLMEFLGYSKEEIEKAVKKRHEQISYVKLTCENATPNQRAFAVDSCFSVPVECRSTR